ncbi:polyprenyl diphosphate synthase [Clostridium oryzae]|uniref:Isoprenyl transferase n=1 Tax=Clostridium oryzae TaxID=1450648 RepID=A0A1V4ISD5_9CLOT|nr:polyprenyl diphosphate synthase [Clostridium oryzae]OPJ62938.1 isoprenyl transferase [Clostridium oryzae]
MTQENIEVMINDKNIIIPKHIAVVCDGSGRWGKSKGLPRSAGHKAGAESVEDVITNCANLGVGTLTLYVFSTENWNRSVQEVNFLIQLFIEFFIKLRKAAEDKIRVKHIGLKENIPHDLIKEIVNTENLTQNNKKMVLNIALNYGGRSEIINAVKRIVKDVSSGKINEDEIDEKLISSYMFKVGQPDVDLIIRTSGENRISNFTLWQAANTKIWITDDYWPDFKFKHLEEAIRFYNKK